MCPGDYDKPMSDKDIAAMVHLQIFHPDLLNPLYFEMEEEAPEQEDKGIDWAGWALDHKIDMMREEA